MMEAAILSHRLTTVLSRTVFSRAYLALLVALILILAALPRLINLDYVPSGSDGDVAWYGINALDWIDRGIWPYYIRELYGAEPLSVYMIGLAGLATGINNITARLASALWGLLWAALLIPAAYWLLADAPQRIRIRAGLLAAFAAALSLHTVHVSRLGLPASYLPAAITGMVACTAWARAKGGWPRWALAGAALALTQYIYIAGRVIPLAMALWFLHDALTDREGFKQRWRGWLILALTAFVLYSPNLYTYLTLPRAFFGRAEAATPYSGAFIWTLDTARYGGPLGLAALKLQRNFEAVGLQWTGPYTSGLGQPMLTPLFFAGFLVSALLLLKPRRIAAWWLWLALPVALLPDVFTSLTPQPHAMRQVDTLAFVFLLAGIGTTYLWQAVEDRLHLPLFRVVVIVVALGVTALPAANDLRRYFLELTPKNYANPELSWRGDQASLDIARRIVSQPGEAYLVPYTEYERSTIAWVASGVFRQRGSAISPDGELRLTETPSTITVVVPADPHRVRWDGHPAQVDDRLWALMHNGRVDFLPPLTAEQIGDLTKAMDETGSERLIDRSGMEIARFYTLSTPADLFAPRPVITFPAQAAFNDELELVGYDVANPDLTPGEVFFVTLYWRVLKSPAEDYEIFVQLWNREGESVSQWQNVPYGAMYRTRIWRADEMVATHHWLQLPLDAPEGPYQLIAGLYRTMANERVPLTGGVSADYGNQVAVAGTLRYLSAIPNETGTPPLWPIQFGTVFSLAGLDIRLDGTVQTPGRNWTAEPGQTLMVRPVWQTLQPPPVDYSVFLHLIRRDEIQPAAQFDTLIRRDLPTSAWRSGESLGESLSLTLPDDLPAGEYGLWLGMYHFQTGERLPVIMDGETQVDDRLLLAEITVGD